MNVRSIKLFLATVGLVAVTAAHAVVAQPYSALYVFGDSLSDAGNNSLVPQIGGNPGQVILGNSYIPSQTYSNAPFGTYSNGPVWSTQFANMIGLGATPSAMPSLALGNNLGSGGIFAFGGATTSGGQVPSLLNQVGMYQSYLNATQTTASASALYVVAGGGNNARAAFSTLATQSDFGVIGSTASSAAAQYANDIGAIVDQLQAAGAQNIIVWNTPNLGLAPAVTALPFTASGLTGSQLGSLVSGTFNGALTSRLAGETGVKLFDLYGLVGLASANGFTNTTDACGAPSNSGVCPANIANALFWDGIHPTTAAHTLIAQQVFALAVPEPSEIAMMLLGLIVVAGAARRKSA
jgi:outer membrane lipase/esterase